MKNLLFTRIPSICICFTLIVIGNWGFGLLRGSDVSPFLPMLFVWLMACQLIDMAVSRIEFRKWSHYCIAESVILYTLTLLVSRLFVWERMELSVLGAFTVIFLVTDVFILWYFHKRQEIQAREINQLIQARREG